MNYFVQLSQTNTTLNLAAISDVDWQITPQKIEGLIYTAQVTMQGGGGIYITQLDASELWQAMQRYNQRVGNFFSSVPRLAESLTELATLLAAGVVDIPVDQPSPTSSVNPTVSTYPGSTPDQVRSAYSSAPTGGTPPQAPETKPSTGVRYSRGRVTSQPQEQSVAAGVRK